MRPDDRFLGAGLGETQPPLGRGLELAGEDRLWEKLSEEAAHNTLEGMRRDRAESIPDAAPAELARHLVWLLAGASQKPIWSRARSARAPAPPLADARGFAGLIGSS